MQLNDLIGELADDVMFVGVETCETNFVAVHAVLRSLEASEHDHAFFLKFDGSEWEQNLLQAAVVSFAVASRDCILALVPSGLVVRIVGAEYETQAVDPGGTSFNQLRSATEVIMRHDELYVSGMGREVFVGEFGGEWRRLSVEGADSIGGFFSLDVDEGGCIYAVGMAGEIWRRSGDVWERVPSPTNQKLNRIRYTGSRGCIACGINGTIVQGVEDRWTLVQQDRTNEGLWDLTRFQDEIYITSREAVFRLDSDGVLNPVPFFEDDENRAGSLAVEGNRLWVVGGSSISCLEEGAWRRVW